jgi:hypothetical protein
MVAISVILSRSHIKLGLTIYFGQLILIDLDAPIGEVSPGDISGEDSVSHTDHGSFTGVTRQVVP